MKPLKRTAPLRSLLLLFVLAWTTTSSAQQDQKVVSYGFVSPNTSENLKLKQAIEGMRSPAETNLRNQAINLSCVVRTPIRAFRALGSWSDGAEQSVMVRFTTDEDTLRYVVSRMGRDAQQKYVIYFHPEPGGPVNFYTLRVRSNAQSLTALSSALERAGIPSRTLVPLNGTTTIYIIDLDRNLREKILAAARTLRARVNSLPGKAKLFGDDVRDRARTVFEQDIKNYETKHPNLPPTCDVKRSRRAAHRS
ncbi:MAG TPA: hypothetical protein VJ749_09400 [Pyrinomonadaceae bacterium]|nr:hypothetical protein [Pyrinomonadaceae bacterium]